MKFKCGPSFHERWVAQQSWHPWFAWWPVTVASRDCRWLEIIERKRDTRLIYGSWDYRAWDKRP